MNYGAELKELLRLLDMGFEFDEAIYTVVAKFKLSFVQGSKLGDVYLNYISKEL